MMNDLEIYKGMNFAGFQEGNSVFISDKDMVKMFYHGHQDWRWFFSKLRDVGTILKLNPLIEAEYDEQMGDCYRITFVAHKEKTIPRPDRVTTLARKFLWGDDIVGWKLNDRE